jgi:hypothetical protein
LSVLALSAAAFDPLDDSSDDALSSEFSGSSAGFLLAHDASTSKMAIPDAIVLMICAP